MKERNFIFQVFALVTFWRAIRKENPGAGKG
jgi:hypothetical protein